MDLRLKQLVSSCLNHWSDAHLNKENSGISNSPSQYQYLLDIGGTVGGHLPELQLSEPQK